MKLGELLDEGDIQLSFTVRDKWDAIERMVDHLVQRGRIPAPHRKSVLDALVAREGIASTGMEHGIAIPHASVDVLDVAVAGLGISRDGIEFESSDGNKSHIVILLLIPRKLVQRHIRTLAGIARTLSREDVRKGLLQAGQPAEAYAVIRREESAAATE